MANGAYLPLIFVRGEERNYVFVYRPRDPSLPPFDLTGKTLLMKIKPEGQSEIVYSASPGIFLSNPADGEITIDPTAAMKTAYAFQNATYIVLLDSKRLLHGPLTVMHIYE